METSSVKKETFEKRKVKKKMSKAQIQLAIIKKKQCDAKALTIVEQLLEPKIDSKWLLCNLKHINRSHMEDVIEERAIIKLCGYVLCDNVLTIVIDQKYHISTKNNKVYDVSKRKNFCSSRCYGACNYLLEQMLTSPLWLRDKEEIPEFKILLAKDAMEKSMPGDEIYVRDINPPVSPENKDECVKDNTTCKDQKNIGSTKDLELNADNKDLVENSQIINEDIKISNITEDSSIFKEQFLKNFEDSSVDLEDKNGIIKKCISNNAVKEISNLEDSTLLDCIITQGIKDLSNDTVSLSENMNKDLKNGKENVFSEAIEKAIIKQNTTVTSEENKEKTELNKHKRHKRKNSVKEKQSKEFYNLAMHIEQSVKEWITEDTICLLSGEEEVKNRLLENIAQHDRYLHLCKKLNKLQLEDEKDDQGDLNTNTLKPVPHLSALQEEGKRIELKVKAFYKGSLAIENPQRITEETEQANDFIPVLPLTDAHAPKMLRRRIFLDKLNRVLPDLLRALASNKLPPYVYNSEKSALIKALINTFALSAANIIFKTAEWTLVGLIIIKMLSMIDPHLKILLSAKQASMYISMILMSYKLDSNYLDRLLMELISNAEVSNVDNATKSVV